MQDTANQFLSIEIG